jgi:hypothetical protein
MRIVERSGIVYPFFASVAIVVRPHWRGGRTKVDRIVKLTGRR